MDSIRKTYAVTSVVFLVVLAISPFKDYFREWRAIQNDYNRLIETLPQKVKPVPVALQQIWVRDLDRIDRCVTCHLGVSKKNHSDLPEPFRSHPKMHHDIYKFGCTVCHEGQGLATSYEDAHLASEFWDKPVLPRPYLESSCGRCHRRADEETLPLLYAGKRLIEEMSCVACHDLEGIEKEFAPWLDGVGGKLKSRGWLVRWLKGPSEMRPGTRMPDFLLSDDEVTVLSDFLMSFKRFPQDARLDSLPDLYFQNKDDDDFIASGKKRFREARCISCHAIEGRGGHLASDLGKVGSKARAEWLYNYIRAPKRFQPGVAMPRYGFSDAEAAAVVAYMESEFIDWEAPEDTTGSVVPQADYFERGLIIFNQYNCGGCHHLSSPKVAENRGPPLSAIGSKRVYEIGFGEADIPHTLYDYVESKIASPRSFGENTRMPLFDLEASERRAITAYLLSLRSEAVPLKYMAKEAAPSSYDPQGAVGAILEKYACLKCHAIRGSGGTIAPDLSIVGSKVKRDWVRRYFELPYSLRPIVEERMPNLFISKDEVDVLVSYFFTNLLDNDVTLPEGWRGTPEAARRGQALFREKYGCQSCHIVNRKGGYVGPPLDGVADRLEPAWVFRWLMDPREFKPDTVEPRSGMSESEALDVVAYIMSLKASP